MRVLYTEAQPPAAEEEARIEVLFEVAMASQVKLCQMLGIGTRDLYLATLGVLMERVKIGHPYSEEEKAQMRKDLEDMFLAAPYSAEWLAKLAPASERVQ